MNQNMVKGIAGWCLGLLIASCAKYDAVVSVDGFQVTASSQSVKVNEPVVFSFNTGPDMLIFYSGEPGKEYQHANRKDNLAGVNKLVFQSSMQQGLLPGNDSLRLMISTNLKGYDESSIKAATWVDITSRNTKWPTTLSATFTTSDSIDITDFNTADSINLAFRFTGKPNATAAQRRWQIQNLALSNRLANGVTFPLFAAPYSGAPVASAFAYTGWVQVSVKGNDLPGFNAWNVGDPGQSSTNAVLNKNGIAIRSAYPIQFDPGTNFNNPENEDWLITGKANLKMVMPDPGLAIKNETNASIPGMSYIYGRVPGVYAQYQYSFPAPGTYKVTFVAQNLNNDNKLSVVRQLDITVKP